MGEINDRPENEEELEQEESLDDMAESMQVPSATAAGSIMFSFPKKKQKKDRPEDGKEDRSKQD